MVQDEVSRLKGEISARRHTAHLADAKAVADRAVDKVLSGVDDWLEYRHAAAGEVYTAAELWPSDPSHIRDLKWRITVMVAELNRQMALSDAARGKKLGWQSWAPEEAAA